jgi:hypothetical protein
VKTRIITNSWINWCEVSEISVSNLVAAALAFFPPTSTDPWYSRDPSFLLGEAQFSA